MNQEQIVRKVTKIGNGAHIFAPREWLGEEVTVIRSLKSLPEKIISTVEPYLQNIKGVYLYGSHSRSEAEKDSDIDLLLISDKKLSINKKGYDIICLREEDLQKAIKISPILIYSILSEAIPIINSSLLEKLKNDNKIQKEILKEYIQETNNIIEINKELIDKSQSLQGVAYSLILRLKGIYIINSLFSGNKYSNKRFESWLSRSLHNTDIKAIIKAYKIIKTRENIAIKINSEDLNKLLHLLKKEIDKW